jgi:hypothetical protein
MVIQSPLAADTLLVSDPENPGSKKRMNKILLQIPVRELHNNLVSTDPLKGLPGVRDCSGNILISDTKLRSMLPKHLGMMSDRYRRVPSETQCVIQNISLGRTDALFVTRIFYAIKLV